MQTTPEDQQLRSSASGALRHFHEDGLELRLIPTLIWGRLSLCMARRRWGNSVKGPLLRPDSLWMPTVHMTGYGYKPE